jgi:hypothetical protein
VESSNFQTAFQLTLGKARSPSRATECAPYPAKKGNCCQLDFLTGYGTQMAVKLPVFTTRNQMVERQKETDFLKWLIGFGDPEQCAQLRQRIHQIQREEYCVRRVLILMCVLLLGALAGLGYSLVFIPDWVGRTLPLTVRIFCALGSSAALSSVACGVCWWKRHLRLETLHEECRDVIRTILLTRLNGVPNVDAADFRATIRERSEQPVLVAASSS